MVRHKEKGNVTGCGTEGAYEVERVGFTDAKGTNSEDGVGQEPCEHCVVGCVRQRCTRRLRRKVQCSVQHHQQRVVLSHVQLNSVVRLQAGVQAFLRGNTVVAHAQGTEHCHGALDAHCLQGEVCGEHRHGGFGVL